MTNKATAAGSIFCAARVAGIALAALGMSRVSAEATELKIPRDHPQVFLDVPDGWSIDRSSFAVEMRSPEKNSIVVASVLADRSTVNAWTKEAGEKLKAFGVTFDVNAKGPTKPAEPASAKPAEATKPAETAKSAESTQPEEPAKSADAAKPDSKDDAKSAADAKSAFTTSPDAFTFSGAPSLKEPGTEGSNRSVKPADNSIEGLTGFGTPEASKPKPKLPFKAVQIYGTTMNGKPVDVQVVIYGLPANRVFVMMQESGSDDGRAVGMAASVRGAK